MIISRRLINLAGTLVVVIAFAVGTMLTALPIHFEAAELNDQEVDVAASNQLIQTQIDVLHAKEAELPQVESELAELHQQLPRIPQLADVTRLVVKAAGKANVAIDSVDFGAYAPFAPRDAEAVAEQLPATATGMDTAGPAEEGASNGSGDTGTPAASPTDPSADPSADPAPPAAPVDADSAQQLQFPVTITVKAPDQPAASRFLDELRGGPRLLQIETVNASTNEEDVSLTVTGLVFVSLNH